MIVFTYVYCTLIEEVFLGVHDPENKNVRSNKFCKQFRINFDTIAADEPVTLWSAEQFCKTSLKLPILFATYVWSRGRKTPMVLFAKLKWNCNYFAETNSILVLYYLWQIDRNGVANCCVIFWNDILNTISVQCTVDSSVNWCLQRFLPCFAKLFWTWSKNSRHLTKYSNLVFHNVVFCFDFRAILDKISGELCVNLDSVHQSGVSNGAMFNYYAVSRLR